MKYLTAILGLALCMGACSTGKTDDNTAKEEAKEATVMIDGQWQLASYTAADSTVEVAADNEYVLNFMPADSMFNMTTDCNSIGGMYVVNGDSLKFDNLMSTKMMCPEIAVENAFIAIFPEVNTFAVENDTVLQLKKDDAVLAQFNKKAADAAAETTAEAAE